MKPKAKKSVKKPLSDKIADALTIKPRADIEDDHIFNTKPSTVSRDDLSSDSEDEALISDFRKQNVNLLSDISKKYEGQVVSSKDLHVTSSDEGSVKDGTNSVAKDADTDSDNKDFATDTDEKGSVTDSDESDDYSIIKVQNKLNLNSSDDVSSPDSEDENDEENEEEDEVDGYDISQLEEPMKEQFEHVKKQNISEEAKKGMCVRNQLLLWEGLLEMRIHMQRCVNTANMMPTTEAYSQLKESKDFVDENSIAINNVSSVIDKLLQLQTLLLNKFPETSTLVNTKQGKSTLQNANEDSDEEIPSDTDNEEIPSDTDAEDELNHKEIKTTITSNKTKKRKLEEYESDVATLHNKFKKFRDATIQKWHEKTRIATAANIKNAPTNTILQQISYILSDRNKLLRRTQLKRSDYDIVGYKTEHVNENVEENGSIINPLIKDRKDNDEYIPEIFDDSDFYHQLLRELIECKSADISDPVQLSRQWIALQQMRSKMKRKVDTKATKGRRIKYVVHNKLVNYMAPEKCSKWNEESTNELYSSLFGKMFEQNNVGLNVNLDNFSIK